MSISRAQAAAAAAHMRMRYGLNQKEFCARIGMTTQNWNQSLNADRLGRIEIILVEHGILLNFHQSQSYQVQF